VADAPAPPPPPVAIRITRPYATEEEYLEKELETLTRAGITLLGAQSRPQGVVLRFELVLTSGVVLMRGEGRVLGFKANAFEGLGGLTLRFTRLDTRSKALVDRAAALREMRRPSSRPPDPLDMAPRPAAAVTIPEVLPVPVASEPTLPGPPPLPASSPLPAPAPAPAFAPMPAPAPPPGRDSLLERLRARAKALDVSDIERILSSRRQA
jgi:hypothetical protein